MLETRVWTTTTNVVVYVFMLKRIDFCVYIISDEHNITITLHKSKLFEHNLSKKKNDNTEHIMLYAWRFIQKTSSLRSESNKKKTLLISQHTRFV